MMSPPASPLPAVLLLFLGGTCWASESSSPRSTLPLHHQARSSCWGHEKGCTYREAFRAGPQGIKCDPARDPYSGRSADRVFFEQADFGYLAKIRETVQEFCSGGDSRLSCSKNLQFCQGRNIMVDLRDVQKEERSLRYQMDVLKQGEIGGSCKSFSREALERHFEYMAPLQSWSPELRNFVNISSPLGEDSDHCDVVIEEPKYVMKLDATVNYYHHFCDFFNLYLSLHLVDSLQGDDGKDQESGGDPNPFSLDKRVLIWDNDRYHSNFGGAFRAFTKFPLLDLRSFGSARVCFRRLVMPLPPRMFFGLYYNTPLVPGCSNSGLFTAFSEFMMHRLGIAPDEKNPETTDSSKVRVTFLSRATKHRRILNEDELIKALESTGRYRLLVARFTHGTDFLHQLRVIRRQTDILVGMHGSGLTHLLFLPPWGSVFEAFDCGDPECYSDLARLRGVPHVGWTHGEGPLAPKSDADPSKEPDPRTAHEKFASYSFDVKEFVRKVDEAAGHVLRHEEFVKRDIRRKRAPKEEL